MVQRVVGSGGGGEHEGAIPKSQPRCIHHLQLRLTFHTFPHLSILPPPQQVRHHDGCTDCMGGGPPLHTRPARPGGPRYRELIAGGADGEQLC